LGETGSVLEARESATFVVTFGAGVVVKLIWLAFDLLAEGDFGQGGDVVCSSKRGSLVTKSSLWIWHVWVVSLLLLSVEGVLSEVRVELHQLKSIRGVSLILGRRIITLTVFGAYESNNFPYFAFLRHSKKPSRLGDIRLAEFIL
jgi:hypothetical protein